MQDKKDYRLMQIIESIVMAANEEYEKKPFNYAKLVTFAEVLTIIQEQLSDEERKAYMLDFDIDKKYL